jgi:hypothetical protein
MMRRHRHALHCGNSKARTGYIRPITPASSYTPVNKPQTTFLRLDGRTKLDRLLQHEERDTKLRARVERIKEHLGKEEYMNEPQKRDFKKLSKEIVDIIRMLH